MIINGRLLADEVLAELKPKIEELHKNKIQPKLAIVTLGDEASWKVYVNAKIRTARELGIQADVVNLKNSDEKVLLQTIKSLNDDPAIHGLIVQRPFPQKFDKEKVINAISKDKDIDGFRKDSPYSVPVWQAVSRIITYISEVLTVHDFEKWLSNQRILVVGKGETAGSPVILALKKKNLQIKVVDSSTIDRKKMIGEADIIISAVGKNNVIRKEEVKQGVILIGIGIHSERGKLVGDYEQNDMRNVASFYTPTPGGVGPLNLAFLFKNVITAARKA